MTSAEFVAKLKKDIQAFPKIRINGAEKISNVGEDVVHAGCKIVQDAGCQIQDTRFRMQDTGCLRCGIQYLL